MVYRKGAEDAKRRCFSFLLRGQKGKNCHSAILWRVCPVCHIGGVFSGLHMGERIGKMYDFVNSSCFSPSQRKARNYEISASLRLRSRER